MKGMKKARLAPANKQNSRNLTWCGNTFTPKLDLNAKWHQRFDDMMSDKKHRKKMSKVSLPRFKMQEPDWE